MAKYLDSIPEDKAGHKGEAGQQYRSHQLANQLPVHDFDDSYCDKLSDQERELMRAFNDKRDAEAAGQGNIKERTEKEISSWVSYISLLTMFIFSNVAALELESNYSM